MRRHLAGVMAACLSSVLACQAYAMSGTPDDPVKPDDSASKVRITFTADTDPAKVAPIRLLEGIEIWPAENEENITHYNVYWGDVMRNKLGLSAAPRLAHLEATGEKIDYEFPPEFAMEAGAFYVLVCSENDGVEFCGKDNNYEKVTDPLLDIAGNLQNLKTLVNSNQSLPGVDVMAGCGDLVCNGIETINNCPSDCASYGLASFNFQTLCRDVQEVHHPESVEDIQRIIRRAAEENKRVKISSGQGYHTTSGSATTIVCTDGIVMIMDRFDHNQAELGMSLEQFEGQEVVSVAAGTSLHELGEWLYERGKGLGYVHLGWRDVSVAGAMGTSAHGSSPKNRNILSQQVVAVDIITADGQLRSFSKGTTGKTDPDMWKSLTTHLGYLGVITRVKIEVQPATNTHVRITFHDEDELFTDKPDSVLNDIRDCDYGQYNWFPSQNRYLRTCGVTTDLPAEEGANNELLFPLVDFSQFSPKQTMQVLQVGSADPASGAHEGMSYLRLSGWHLDPPLTKTIDGKKRYTSNATGPTHRITSSKLIDTVGREMFQLDWELAVPQQHIQDAMEYIRDFSNGLNTANREIPVPLIGIFIRFSKSESNSLMAYTGSGNGYEENSTVVHIEMPIYVPVNLSDEEFQEYVGPYEEAVRTLITRFKARGHWGKNMHSSDPWMFEFQRDLGVYGDYLTRFNRKVGELDPKGMFANPFAKSIGITYPEFEYPASW